jgi:Co/Zn/Cd efflux system component
VGLYTTIIIGEAVAGWQAKGLSLLRERVVSDGTAAAIGNGGVAWLLREPGKHNMAIRLAYVHNLGEVGVSFAPVVAGLLVTLLGRSVFDPATAVVVAVWLIWSTL